MGKRTMSAEVACAHQSERLIQRTLEAVEDLLAALPDDGARARVRTFLAAHYPLFVAAPTLDELLATQARVARDLRTVVEVPDALLRSDTRTVIQPDLPVGKATS